MTSLETRLVSGLQALGIPTSDAQRQKLLHFLQLLQKWNTAFNLSAVRDPLEMVGRHLLDSLTLQAWLGDSRLILDVGSGAGLPGIPLAIMNPDKSFVLLDSNGKKTRFLFQAKLALELPNITVENSRIEHYQSPGQIDIVTCRAVSSLSGIVASCGHLITKNTRLLAMKAEYPGGEIAELPPEFQVTAVTAVTWPGSQAARHIVEVRRWEQSN
ncbi:MAG: hypothetical protein RLZZ385_757 [Pseudomonadota bacterium]|jgi:16S rRNA (guanine527-N7)-methyltransferase